MTLVVRSLPGNAAVVRGAVSIPGSGRSPGVGQGKPPQCSCLENPWAEEPGRLPRIRLQRAGHN